MYCYLKLQYGPYLELFSIYISSQFHDDEWDSK